MLVDWIFPACAPHGGGDNRNNNGRTAVGDFAERPQGAVFSSRTLPITS
jgi:hypothetical protein